MTVVQQLYVEPEKARPALQRIRRFSLPFEIVFAALAITVCLVLAIVLALVLFGQPGFMHLRLSPEGGELILGDPSGYPGIDLHDLPLLSRLASLVVAAGFLCPQIGAFYALHRLFGAYRRGAVFATDSIRWLRISGAFLIAAGLAPLMLQPLVQALGLLDQRWFPGNSIAYLLVGAALFVLASIFSLGREIEKEGEGYV